MRWECIRCGRTRGVRRAPRDAGSAERGAARAGGGAGGGPCGTGRRRLQDPDLWHWREGICDGLDYNSLRVDTVFIYM